MANEPNEGGAVRWWRRAASRLHLRRVLTRDVLILAALSGLAVTQPLLDLFGRNPEIFVAADASRLEIVVFAVLVTLAVPAVCVVVEVLAFAVSERVGRLVHAGLVVSLATLLGLSIANQLGLGDVASWLTALAVGTGVAVASLRVKVVETFLRYLSGALLIFLVAFLFFSPSGELVRSAEASAAEGIRIENPAPVVMVQLDELPLASILDGDGEVNAERFPNLARLAAEGTWFRNATTISAATTISVPAALTGKMPNGPGVPPVSSEHPDNLFTLLGETYAVTAEESVADLCPDSVCAADSSASFDDDRLEQVARDAAVVLGHVTLPPGLRAELPAVDQSWGGFLPGDVGYEASTEAETGTEDIDEGGYQAGPGGWSPQGQTTILEGQTEAIGGSDGPALSYSHAVLPHYPWNLAPSGLEFAGADEVATPGLSELRWTDSEWFARQGLQRHLLQVGHVDRLIGEMIDRLEAEGIWEETLFVVTADHGISFEPGEPARFETEDNRAEIYHVPLFIKAPGQTEGDVRDDTARVSDILPSIVDLLGIEVDWTFDGRSLFGDEPEPSETPIVSGNGISLLTTDLDAVMDVVARNRLRLPYGDDMDAVAAVGPNGGLVGRNVDELTVIGPSDVRWTLDQAERLADWQPEQDPAVPLFWRGTVTMPDGGPPPSDILAVVNGRVAGVLGGFGEAGSAPDEYTALISGEALTVGPNEVALLVPVVGTGDQFALTGPP